MKRFLIIILFTVLVLSCVPARQVQPPDSIEGQPQAKGSVAELTFTFTRQTGPASNQYAVWIENSDGQHIKTLYASRWTANGGFSRRPTSIPMWVRQSGLANMSPVQVDAVSGATPRTGNITHTWDSTDSEGNVVPSGDYTLILEGTLRWENQVYYRAPITLNQLTEEQLAASLQAYDFQTYGLIVPVSVEYAGDGALAERAMISNVVVRVLR